MITNIVGRIESPFVESIIIVQLFTTLTRSRLCNIQTNGCVSV